MQRRVLTLPHLNGQTIYNNGAHGCGKEIRSFPILLLEEMTYYHKRTGHTYGK